MSKVKTKITVDTDKLKNEKPGMIQDRSIIVMIDESGATDSYYDDPTENNYKDKLHTFVDWNDDREWSIEALNGKDDVVFTDMDCPDELNLFQSKPVKDGMKKIKVKVKAKLEVHTNIWYTFKIEFEGNEYTWDPDDEARIPPKK